MNIKTIKGKIFFLRSNSNGLKIEKDVITNDTDQVISAFYLGKIKKRSSTLKIIFDGEVLFGAGASLSLISFSQCASEVHSQFPSVSFKESTKLSGDWYTYKIDFLPRSQIRIDGLSIEFVKKPLFEEVQPHFRNDILVISPSYPTEQNKYFGGFVHSRLKVYQTKGIKFDLAVIHDYDSVSTYNFENVKVNKGGYDFLTSILSNKIYKKIIIHFFDGAYAKVLDREDLSSTQIFLWVHGPETLFWDWNKFTTPYFQEELPLTKEQIKDFEQRNNLIRRFNEKSNVHWIFVSKWIKKQSEKLTKLQFARYSVIPNFIDEYTFSYAEKSPEARRNIFLLRRFDNINKYSVDVAVRAIRELSQKPLFKQLTFNIYGTGSYYDELLGDLKRFSNVHLYKHFLSHDQIAQIHKNNGIALFPTRYDAQGVSMCEAASSGLAVVGTNLEAVKEFLPEEYETLVDPEDYKGLAECIIKLNNNPELFQSVSKAMHEKIKKLTGFEATLKKEIELIKAEPLAEITFNNERCLTLSKEPVLSIIVPSYNVEKYIAGTVHSLITEYSKDKIEIILVNDGSKDNTLFKAKELQKKYGPLIRIIDKPNGGHGSTINVGIVAAKGRYLKIIDGDDTVVGESFDALIEYLLDCDSDCVLSDYYIDRIDKPDYYPVCIYQNFEPRKKYKLNSPRCYFETYGPVLATGTFRTNAIKNKFTLSEHLFYVDMEFDAFVIPCIETISYLPGFVYKYRQGHAGQSISMESFRKNFPQHEKVIFNLINFLKAKEIDSKSFDLIKRTLISPMIKGHYFLLLEAVKNPKCFFEFDTKLKDVCAEDLRFSDLYHKNNTRKIRFSRFTKGRGIYLLLLRNKMRKVNSDMKIFLRTLRTKLL